MPKRGKRSRASARATTTCACSRWPAAPLAGRAGQLHWGRHGSDSATAVELGALDACSVALLRGRVLVIALDGPDARCMLLNTRGQLKACVTLPGAEQVRISAQDEHLLVFDRAGRLLDIDTLSGQMKIFSLS